MQDDYEESLKLVRLVAEKELSETDSGNDGDQKLRYELEKAKLEVERLQLDNKNLAESVSRKSDDRTLRRDYAKLIFRFLITYSVFCSIIIVLQGDPDQSFKLPTEVVNTLIGSTALSVIGLVGAIVAGLFRPGKE